MKTTSRKTGLVLVGAFTFLAAVGRPATARAQSYEVLHSFSVEGGSPNGLLLAADGRIYGTSQSGGRFGRGSVFVLTPNGTDFDFSTVREFSGADGSTPWNRLMQATDGNIYGTTERGGANDLGTVFRVSASGQLTTLHSFSGGDGRLPRGGLVQGSDGSFYGTTEFGGPTGLWGGTFYRIDSSGSLTTLHAFDPATDQAPRDLVLGTDGNFYGATGDGRKVVKIDTAGVVTTLYVFTRSGPDAIFYPSRLIEGSDGRFYGTSWFGGAYGGGAVFRIDPSGAFTILHSFRRDTEISEPAGGLVLGGDGALYGTTQSPAAVFRMDMLGSLTVLHLLSYGEGRYPGQATPSGVIVGGDGVLYGSANGGGSGDSGTVFRIDPSGVFSVLHDFAPSEGFDPFAGVVRTSAGDLYGTTLHGGRDNAGTVFRLDASDSLTTLHSFESNPPSSLGAYGGLVLATDGLFYGTTQFGPGGEGSVYKVDAAGAFTTLHSFGSNGDPDGRPMAPLIEGSDGDLYGTTVRGMIFRISRSGALTQLHVLDYGVEGQYPQGALVQASDGSFYGTTASCNYPVNATYWDPQNASYWGDCADTGTVFRIDASGSFSTLHSFTGADGAIPWSGLTRGDDGRFYGTTLDMELILYGSVWGYGTVYAVDASGALTTLHRFAGTDGAMPFATLVEGTDGSFYGTTFQGGANGFGTIFRISPSGFLATIHHFTGADGAYATGALVQGSDGKFYGTTRAGGTYGGGVVFRFTPPPNTTTGSNVPVEILTTPTPIQMTFDSVLAAGATTVTAIDPATAGQVPGGFAVSETVAYEIHTTATVSGPITIAFVVPGSLTEAEFNALRVLHNENGVLVDVTASSPARNYATRTIFAITSSFSPFYIVRTGPHSSTLFDTTKAYKAGSTVPVKLRLLNSANANVSSEDTTLTARSLTRIGGATANAVLDSGNANPDNAFRYDSALGGYIFNLSTKGLQAGRYALSFWVGPDRAFSYNVVFEVR